MKKLFNKLDKGKIIPYVVLFLICISFAITQSCSADSTSNIDNNLNGHRKEIELKGRCYDFSESHYIGQLNHIGPFWFSSRSSLLTFRFKEDFELIVDGVVQDLKPPMIIFVFRFSGFCPIPIQYKNINGSKEISMKGYCEAYDVYPIVQEDTVNESCLFHVSDFMDFDQLASGLTHNDFNKDGLMDFAVIAAEYSKTNISIFYNEGNMVFTRDVAYTFRNQEWGEFNDLDSGDFDGDGAIDLMFTQSEDIHGWKTNGTIYLLFNDGHGTFSNITLVTRHCSDIEDMYGRFNPVVCPSDYDMDGDLDFMVGDNSGIIEFYKNNGSGNFNSDGILYDYGQLSWGLTSGDFDNDGDCDLIIAAEKDNEAGYGRIYMKKNLMVESNGSICFQNDVGEILFYIQAPRGTSYLDSMDYNGDGWLDFIAGTMWVNIFINQGDALFSEYFTVGQLPGSQGYGDHLYGGGMTSFDMNLDGREDLITGGVQGAIRFYLNNFSSFLPPLKPSLSGDGYWDQGLNHEFEYLICSKDINGDEIYYFVDWGDGTNTGWLGPYRSSEEIIVWHNWSDYGLYYITVQAKDTNNQTSSVKQGRIILLRERPFAKYTCKVYSSSFNWRNYGVNPLLLFMNQKMKNDGSSGLEKKYLNNNIILREQGKTNNAFDSIVFLP